MTTAADPWSKLNAPGGGNQLAAMRVDRNHPWNFFWALGSDQRCMLLLQHGADNAGNRRTPRLRDIEIVSAAANQTGKSDLSLKLLNETHRDIFHRLCLDIIDSTKDASSEAEALGSAISQTWRWHRLLRGGRDDLLSPDEQRGLIGELIFLERMLIPTLQPYKALDSWTGPQGAAQDFEVGAVHIESKSHGRSPSPSIRISSEYQLNEQELEALYLSVVEVSTAQTSETDASTLTEIAHRIKQAIATVDPSAINILEDNLLAAGFKWTDDYSSWRWTVGDIQLYQVKDGFPRITPSDLRLGVENVRYGVSLTECEPFKTSDENLVNMIQSN